MYGVSLLLNARRTRSFGIKSRLPNSSQLSAGRGGVPTFALATVSMLQPLQSRIASASNLLLSLPRCNTQIVVHQWQSYKSLIQRNGTVKTVRPTASSRSEDVNPTMSIDLWFQNCRQQ